MFSEHQIEYMKTLGLDFDFANLTDANWFEIEEKVGDALELSGLDEDYSINEIGIICESILDCIE